MRKILIILFAVLVMTNAVCAGSYVFCQETEVNSEAEEFDFANGLLARGMYDLAVSGYKDFLEKYPESGYAETALHRLGEAYFMQVEYTKSLNVFDSFLQKYPSSRLIHKAVLRKGQIFYLLGNYQEAEDTLGTISTQVQGIPADTAVPADYYLASIYFKKNDFEVCRQILEKLINVRENEKYLPFIYMNLGDTYAGLNEHLKSAEAYSKANSLASGDAEKIADQSAFRAANAYHLSEDYIKASAFYKKIIDNSASGEIFNSAVIGFLSSLYRNFQYQAIIEAAPALLDRVTDDDIKAQVLFILGSSLFYESNFSEAVKVYAEAASAYPDNVFGIKSRLNEGWAYFKLEEMEKCIEVLDIYLAGTEESMDEALYVKAKAFAEIEKNKDALDIYNSIISDYPESNFKKESLYDAGWLLDLSGDTVSAIGYYEKFVDEYPEDARSPEVLLKMAQENFRLSRFPEAQKGYDQFLAKFKDSPLKENVLFQLGMTQMEQEDYDGSIKTYAGFMQEFPESKVKDAARYWMASAYQRKEEWDKAIEIFSPLLSNKESGFNARASEAAAFCYFQKGNHLNAADIYYNLIIENSDFQLPKDIYRWTADFYLAAGKNEKSLKVLEALLEKYPETARQEEIYYLAGENQVQLKNWEKAVQEFHKALAGELTAPYLERTYLGLGRAYFSLADHENALKYFDEALKNHKENMTGALARLEIGNVRFVTSDFPEATKQYMMVAILYDDEGLCSMALFQAGLSFEKSGNLEKALDVFAELRERYPENNLARKAEIEISRIKGENK
ncbi:MAG: tetratricopeptide repeat protein [Candidatus Omnitrophota bacterium]